MIDAQLRRRAATEALQHDIGAFRQIVDDLPPFIALQVQGDAALVVIKGKEQRRLAVFLR